MSQKKTSSEQDFYEIEEFWKSGRTMRRNYDWAQLV